ncbi:Spy/CpxP family protein refolding chaperone [Desulfomicrobium macestii]|uniref:Spy/CpxP family protein refolding chaperone n=1 Tax=Desulfomicrobium macestii TaxID=90731 RepID=A0ABR9H9K9_9BACT|nr:periplasmic heavy metal sensor [Desulfomicrobium macestii]MBE1427431.1 Spy/CpxP family protein refolding chaperone [Desulfomicrobium macestii]
MRKIILSFMLISLLLAAPLWAADNQSVQTQNPSYSGSGYGTEGMGPGMMGQGSGYHGRGSGMMGHDRDMGRGMRGYGREMGPDPQGWQDMPPEQRKQWRERRSQFMQEILPLRQELSAKQMELETLWEQENPDTEKVKALSDRIAELRSKLDRKHDEYLTQCRQAFGDRGWTCPGGGRW